METWGQPQYSFFLPGLEFRLIPQHNCCSSIYTHCRQKEKQTYNAFGVFWKQKGWERSLESVQVSRSELYFAWSWNRGEEKKSKLQNYNWGKTKASLTLSLLFHWWSLSESCFRTDYFLKILRITEFLRQISGFWPADVWIFHVWITPLYLYRPHF